ncbi:hypothetical protein [Bacillus sp. SD088]|uniref:hypothetical protein n=1 Tax=Bacillus sp. SD088 TaxID=2782012 RepID=UPI001A95B461|nr:hypothetical protein [Bacillus sp. SD088]
MNTNFVADTVFLAEGFPGKEVDALLKQWKEAKMHPSIVSDKLGEVSDSRGVTYQVDQSFPH